MEGPPYDTAQERKVGRVGSEGLGRAGRGLLLGSTGNAADAELRIILVAHAMVLGYQEAQIFRTLAVNLNRERSPMPLALVGIHHCGHDFVLRVLGSHEITRYPILLVAYQRRWSQ